MPSRRTLSDFVIKGLAEDTACEFHITTTRGRQANGTGNIDIERSSIDIPTARVTDASFQIYDHREDPGTPDLAIVVASVQFHCVPRISHASELQTGEEVFCFGFPTGGPHFGKGTFSHRNDEYANGDARCSQYLDVCQLYSAGGNSGAAVFDVHGDVVGVISKGYPEQEGSVGIVPVGYMRALLERNGFQI